LKFASVSFYCQVSDTGSVGWASSYKWSPQYRINSTLSDFNDISYVGRLHGFQITWFSELESVERDFFFFFFFRP
jgi:hypothetical protein